MRVGLVGDLEGDVDAAVRWLTYLGERGDVRTVYQLGDLRFGMLGVRPRLLAHGHFHAAGETDVRIPGCDVPTTIWSLAARQDPGTVRVLDLETFSDVDVETAGGRPTYG